MTVAALGGVPGNPTRRTMLESLILAGGFLTASDVLSEAAEKGADTRAASFIIGDNLSLAALLYARGGAKETIDGLLGRAERLAKELGVAIKPFPAKQSTEAATSADVIHYLIQGDGWAIGKALVDKFDKDHGVLFEVAVKSNLLILLYQPGDDSGLGNLIRSRCEALKLPGPLWMPVVNAVAAKKKSDEVRDAVLKMHKDVTDYLVKLAS